MATPPSSAPLERLVSLLDQESLELLIDVLDACPDAVLYDALCDAHRAQHPDLYEGETP